MKKLFLLMPLFLTGKMLALEIPQKRRGPWGGEIHPHSDNNEELELLGTSPDSVDVNKYRKEIERFQAIALKKHLGFVPGLRQAEQELSKALNKPKYTPPNQRRKNHGSH